MKEEEEEEEEEEEDGGGDDEDEVRKKNQWVTRRKSPSFQSWLPYRCRLVDFRHPIVPIKR